MRPVLFRIHSQGHSNIKRFVCSFVVFAQCDLSYWCKVCGLNDDVTCYVEFFGTFNQVYIVTYASVQWKPQ